MVTFARTVAQPGIPLDEAGDQDLLDAIQLGLERDRTWLEDERAIAELRGRFETLTAREREVMALVVNGRLNNPTGPVWSGRWGFLRAILN